MAKKKQKQPSIPNKALHCRVSYLYQAATYLASQDPTSGPQVPDSNATAQSKEDAESQRDATAAFPDQTHLRQALARSLVTDLRATALKGVIRISPAIKATICKFCDTLLVEGKTSTSLVENKSKGGKKPWADVFVVKCTTCGREKRFPVGAPPQKRRPLRDVKGTKTHDAVEGTAEKADEEMGDVTATG
ncbi:RNAse P Rpr2/Rpp21/SNM1 subunit domain-containing protein [Xylariaceae sp. FL1019]|nr:RNAse P Rpr2/Rpp21/SNM1 subunit domain-containing protein [Xylariaceae sp. FL1019]